MSAYIQEPTTVQRKMGHLREANEKLQWQKKQSQQKHLTTFYQIGLKPSAYLSSKDSTS